MQQDGFYEPCNLISPHDPEKSGLYGGYGSGSSKPSDSRAFKPLLALTGSLRAVS